MTKKEFIALVANYMDIYRASKTENTTLFPHQDGHILVEWKLNQATVFPPNDHPGSFSNRTWDRWTMRFMKYPKYGLDYNIAGNKIASTLCILKDGGLTIRYAQDMIDEYDRNKKK